MAATAATVEMAMREYDKLGLQGFLDKYASGFPPHKLYLRHASQLYPLKALWAASCRPQIHSGNFNPPTAYSGFEALGFTDFVNTDEDEEVAPTVDPAQEGERHVREINVIWRDKALVSKAKKYHGYVCMGCGFDFEAFYGPLGRQYIECHHIDPLSGRDGKNMPTTIDELAMLCSNCHRMVHRKQPCLTIAELKSKISEAGNE